MIANAEAATSSHLYPPWNQVYLFLNTSELLYSTGVKGSHSAGSNHSCLSLSHRRRYGSFSNMLALYTNKQSGALLVEL